MHMMGHRGKGRNTCLNKMTMCGEGATGDRHNRVYFTTTAPSGSVSSASVAISTLLPRSSGLSGHSGT